MSARRFAMRIMLLLVLLMCAPSPLWSGDDAQVPPGINAPAAAGAGDAAGPDNGGGVQQPDATQDAPSSGQETPPAAQTGAEAQHDAQPEAPENASALQPSWGLPDMSAQGATADDNATAGTGARYGETLATPSPFKDKSSSPGKTFSFAPLRSFKPQAGVLTTVKGDPSAAEAAPLEISTCDSISGYQNQNLESFKNYLLQKAKSEAAFQYFTRVYSGQRQLGLQQQLPPNYQEAVADRVQFVGKPTYYNGDVFGELCVKVQATLSQQQMQSVTPVTATLINFCYQQPGIPDEQLQAIAENAALERITQNIAPGAQTPQDLRGRLLRDAKITGAIGGANRDVYCLSMQVEVSPLELGVYVPDAKQRQAPPKDEKTLAERLAPRWSLDLSQYAPGDMAPEFGKNLVVYQDVNGKSLGPLGRDGALAVIPLTSQQDFTLRVLVQKQLSYDFLYKTTIEFLRMHFANKAWEQVAFVMSMDDKNQPVAYFQSRTSDSDTFPWDMAVNFNDCYLVKEGAQLRFFFNGTFVLAYPTSGNTLTQVRVPLNWNERLYNVLLGN